MASPPQKKDSAEALRDGHSDAAISARAVGKELDGLRSTHWTLSAKEAHGVKEMYRRVYLPLLSKSPFSTGPNQVIRESPRTTEFVATVYLTFGLK